MLVLPVLAQAESTGTGSVAASQAADQKAALAKKAAAREAKKAAAEAQKAAGAQLAPAAAPIPVEPPTGESAPK